MQYQSALILLADGARPDVMEHLLRRGDLPNIQRHIIERGTVTQALTVFPSTTGPAYLPFLTGCFPGTCNIPGIRWFDKFQMAKHSPSLHRFRSYVGWESYLFNGDLDRSVKTIFELEPKAYSIQSIASRGAGRRDLNRFNRWIQAYSAHVTHQWAKFDGEIARALQHLLPKKPKFVFAAFPAIDEYSHLYHPEHPKTVEAYWQIDYYVGEIVKDLKKMGAFEETLLIITSDHGLTKTDQHFCLISFLKNNGFRPFYYPLIYRSGCNVAVMQSGNAMAHLYFRDPSGWGVGVTYERLIELGLWGVMEELATQKEIAWVAVRTGTGSIIVQGEDGTGVLQHHSNKFRYQILGKDPLSITNEEILWTEEESLIKTIDSPYPDALIQLTQLFQSRRTGDVIVVAKDGYDLRDRFEAPKHHASHGSLSSLHMRVPLYISHPLSVARPIRTVDILPTILNLLEIPFSHKMDGESLING